MSQTRGPSYITSSAPSAVAAFSKVLLGVLLVCGSLKALPVGIPSPAPNNYAHNLQEGVPTPPPDLNFSTPAPRVGSSSHAMKFMKQFGYVTKGDGMADMVYTQEAFSDALKKVQKFGGIPQTGVIDNATIELMQTPRCGLPDVEPEDITGNTHIRKKRYILGSEGWKKRSLTYFVANWSPKLWNMENVKKELRRAFDAWSSYSHLKFTEVEGPDADIVIFFASYDHHDGYAFDGQGGILAHAYYPYEFGHYGGDVHFDESEEWTMDPKDEYSGLDFFTVAVHEIGHSLGLAHSPVSGSIMFPYYKGYTKEFSLDYDDVMAMWELYIKRKLEGDDEFFSTSSTTTTTATPTKDAEDEEHQSDAAADDDDDDVDNEGGKGVDVDNNDDSNKEGVLSDEPRSNDNDSSVDYDDKYNENVGEDEDDDDDDLVRYHGDYETVDEHQKRVSSSSGQDDLPHLPTLPPEGDDARADSDHDEEAEKKRREEERRKEREEEEERKRWEEEIRRREAETRRREEEARRRWEDEEGESGTSAATTVKPPPAIPDICDGNYDSVAVLRQELFIFKGQYLWRYKQRGALIPGYPAKIQGLFADLPSFLKRIDAVYQRQTDSSFVFFIGKYYYVHNGNHLIENSPRPLSDLGIPDLYTKIDAAFFWPRANRTYFFSRNSYFRYDDVNKKMDDGYPRDIKKWNGIPGDLDAVFTWEDDVSYFVKGNKFWKYDNARIRPAQGFPRDAAQYWANCPAKS